jgi:Flp pilus assembly protein TadB
MTGRSTRWILISCLAIAAGIAAIFAFGVPTNTVLLVALALACPLAHLWMMRSGAHDHDHHGNSRPSALEKS